MAVVSEKDQEENNQNSFLSRVLNQLSKDKIMAVDYRGYWAAFQEVVLQINASSAKPAPSPIRKTLIEALRVFAVDNTQKVIKGKTVEELRSRIALDVLHCMLMAGVGDGKPSSDEEERRIAAALANIYLKRAHREEPIKLQKVETGGNLFYDFDKKLGLV